MTTAFGTGVTGPDGRSLDQVQLTGVSARGYHGVLPSERQTGQEFLADVVLYLDTRPAAAGDDLAQTVSYADVASDVHEILKGEPADLVETVAERIAAAVLARPQVEAVDVRVHKPHAPIPVPFADVEVAIRRDRTFVPVVAAPAVLAGSAADPLFAAASPYEPDQQDVFRTDAPAGSWNDAAEHVRSDAPAFGEPVPQDFEPVARAAADETEQFQPEPYQPEPYQPEPVQQRAEAIEVEPLVERVPVIAASAAQSPAEAPEPTPVPELIAPEPFQVVPAAWEPQPDASPQPEQREQLAQEPVFQPEEQFPSEPVFEPVQQYESLQGLDQRQGAEGSNGFAQQYEQFAQQEQAQPEQAQQFEQPQEPQQNRYEQLFDQQYDRGDMETTRVSPAVADAAVGQPEQYTPEQYQPEEYQHEPRDRFDEIPAGTVDVVVAIGANLGDPQATMRSAVAELDRVPGLQITDVSPLARTAAVGGPEEQPDYLNAVLLARTTLSARALLHACQEVENVHGRTREEHWGPRTLDVDLITYGTLTDSADDLEVPHPRAHERAFVLEPWSQIAPEAVLPGLGGGPVAQLAATAPDRAGIRWLALDWLTDPEPEPNGGAPASGHPAGGDVQPAQDAHVAEMPPALPPSVPPSGRPPVTPGGPVVEVPGGGGGAQAQHSGPVDLDRPAQGGVPPQEPYPGGGHPQAYSSGPVAGPGGSVPVPQQVAQAAPAGPMAGITGNGSAVPPPEEALVPAPAPIAPRAVRDTAHEVPEHEPIPQGSSAKPVFAPVNPSRQGSVFPSLNGAAPQDPAAPVFAPVSTPPHGVSDPGHDGRPAGEANGQPHGPANGHANGQPNGHQDPYDNDHTVIRVPGFVGEQRATAPSDGPIDSVPAWVPIRDERGRDV